MAASPGYLPLLVFCFSTYQPACPDFCASILIMASLSLLRLYLAVPLLIVFGAVIVTLPAKCPWNWTKLPKKNKISKSESNLTLPRAAHSLIWDRLHSLPGFSTSTIRTWLQYFELEESVHPLRYPLFCLNGVAGVCWRPSLVHLGWFRTMPLPVLPSQPKNSTKVNGNTLCKMCFLLPFAHSPTINNKGNKFR